MNTGLYQRYESKISGHLGCFDRVVITGTLTEIAHPDAMSCRRYLDFAGTLEDRTSARHDLNKVSRTVRDDSQRTWRGFNFFHEEDLKVLLALLRGEFAINGLSNRRLRSILHEKSSGQISRILKRLRLHGLIKKVIMLCCVESS